MDRQLIGKGGYGNVFLINNNTAVKEVDIPNMQMYNMMVKANNNALNFIHKNILGIKKYEVVKNDNGAPIRIDIYMEYVNGVVLNNWKISNNTIMLDVFYQIADALEYMHSKNIAHRDIKPTNILIRKNIPFIIDFDMVCRNNECQGFGGTLIYLDPNVYTNYMNNKPINYMVADVYALIVTMFFITNRHYPWFKTELRDKDKLFKAKLDPNKNKRIYSKSGIPELDKLLENGLDINIKKRMNITEIKEVLGMLIKKYADA